MSRFMIWPAIAAVTILGLAACGGAADGKGDTSSDALAGKAANVSQLLPKEVRDRGFINAGGPVQAPPYIYKDEKGTTVGLTIDLVDAAAASLGVDVKWENVSYDTALPAMQADRIDFFTGSYVDTAEREQQVDFVDYYLLKIVLITQKGNPKGLTSLNDLCGKTAAVARGSSPVETVKEQNKVCMGAGKPLITVNEVPTNSDAKLQVQSGRADAFFGNLASARWMETDGQPFVMVDTPVSTDYAGAAFPKSDPALRDALVKGFANIIDNGTYSKLLKQWNVPELAMDKPVVNGATTAPLQG